jgi:hypothetical protein
MKVDLLPDFGDVATVKEPCTPRTLYRALVNIEDHVHYFEAAFKYVNAALNRTVVPSIRAEAPNNFIDELIRSALCEWPRISSGYASSWPVRVAREFAPIGLTDGAWLQGALRANVVESQVGMTFLKQFMIRFGGPGVNESYVNRYTLLLRSIGIAPRMVSRLELGETSPCDLSFEHALLGLSLSLFPSSLMPETIGYNLWMSTIGPCPLLEQLADTLRKKNVCIRYLEMHDRNEMASLARKAAVEFLQENGSEDQRTRIARGFAAAQQHYYRWAEGMMGRNIPMMPRDFVLELIKRKAHFALGHHKGIRLGDSSLEDLFAGERNGHEKLLQSLAKSHLVSAGTPDRSRFLTHTISIDGPMFGVFTAAEQTDLREWIASLGSDIPEPKTPIALEGIYVCPQDVNSLQQYALNRYGKMRLEQLCYELSNSDRYPSVRVFAKLFVGKIIEDLTKAFSTDPKLNSLSPPQYSEDLLAKMIAENHAKNIKSRKPLDPSVEVGRPSIGILFDGSWLQGFADVTHADLEEYGWLFRIYASEQGDGNLAWNHNLIARHMAAKVGFGVSLPATDRQLYDAFTVDLSAVALIAISLNTQFFLPEILGLNLGIEAAGVGGSFLDLQENASKKGNEWGELNFRLHNSIDNYSSGHTKWSADAVAAFMARVKDTTPTMMTFQWARIWLLWRFQEISRHGLPEEREALTSYFGAVSSFAPTDLSKSAL